MYGLRMLAAQAIHEDLTLLNHAEEPVDLEVLIEASADFAEESSFDPLRSLRTPILIGSSATR